MSSHRIIIGLLIGGCLLVLGFAAVWFLEISPLAVPIALLVVASVGSTVMGYLQRGRSLRPFWERGCMGIRWRRRFPDTPKDEIREFLLVFVDAFAFNQRRRCSFSPDDRVLDVYRALYPPGTLADSMELETLALSLRNRYGIDLIASWRDDITLGELYQHIRARAA